MQSGGLRFHLNAMKATSARKRRAPRQPRRELPYDESVDEPGALLERENVDVEGEVPQKPNPNIDRGDKDEFSPPAFEE
jgi:hypothetical protein